jgi:hypothetical protein
MAALKFAIVEGVVAGNRWSFELGKIIGWFCSFQAERANQ